MRLAVTTAPDRVVFDHPVLVGVFADPEGLSGADVEIVVKQAGQIANRPYFVAADSRSGRFVGRRLGVYTEDVREVGQPAARVVFCQDSLADPIVPPGMRPWDQIWLELYLGQVRGQRTETLTQSVARWNRQMCQLLKIWPGDCGVIAQCYLQTAPDGTDLWTVAEVRAALAWVAPIVNLSPRIKVVAGFAWQRANGLVAHAALRAIFDECRVAGIMAGRPIFLEDDMVSPTITVTHFDPAIRRGQGWEVDFVLGEQTAVTVRIGSDGLLKITATNAAGADATGRPRRVEVMGLQEDTK